MGSYIDQMGINNGIGNVSPSPDAGQVGGAQLFDGSTTKIEVPANPSLDFAANNKFSVEFWYKGVPLLQLKTVVSRELLSLTGGLVFGGTGKAVLISIVKLLFPFWDVITDDNWHYIAATRNGTTGEFKSMLMAV